MYVEYYNIITNGAPGSSLAVTTVFFVIVSVMLFLRFRKTDKRLAKAIPILGIFGIVAYGSMNIDASSEYRRLKKVLINKEHTVVQGTVENYSPESSDGQIPEFFTVNSVGFTIPVSDTGAFSKNGVVYEGADIRIFYAQDHILSLWIKE